MQDQENKKRGRKPANKQPEERKEEQALLENAAVVDASRDGKGESEFFTLEQVQKMIEEAIAKKGKEEREHSKTNDEVVVLRFQDEVNDNNVIQLGPNGKFGQITGKEATITIRKQDFIGEFRTTLVQSLLKSRNLIVISGLTEDERKIYGVDYQKGEFLEPIVYKRLIEMGDEILDIFPALNPTWREMVASKFMDAYDNKKLKCTRETLLALNKISKADYAHLPKDDVRRKGGFYAIIHRMNAADEADDEE